MTPIAISTKWLEQLQTVLSCSGEKRFADDNGTNGELSNSPGCQSTFCYSTSVNCHSFKLIGRDQFNRQISKSYYY